MGKSVKRLVHLLTLLVLMTSIAVPDGWAKEQENKPLVKEIMAWLEDEEVRLQIELEETPEKAVLSFFQSGQETSRTFRKEDRLSVAVELASTEPLVVALTTSSPEEAAVRWEIAIPEDIDVTAKEITLRKETWDKKAAKKVELLEIVAPGEADDHSDSGEKPKGADVEALRKIVEMEPNHSMEKADWLYEGQDAFGKIKEKGDVDYWKIRAPQNGFMNVSLKEIPAKQNFSLYVFDAKKQELARSESPGNDDEIIAGISVERREWYYIMVQGAGSSFSKDADYRLRVEFQSGPLGGDADPYEPNQTFANAYDLENEHSLQANLHSPQDVDFYRFAIKLASTVEVKLEGIPAGMDIDVYLLDSKGSIIGKSEKPRNIDEEIVVNADPGTYGIKVMASKRSGFTANTYKLSVLTHTMPVILIPGIGGTRLQMEEEGRISEIWLGAKKIIWGINDPEHRRALSLTYVREGGVEVEPRIGGIRVFPEQADEGFRAIEFLSYDYPEQSEQYHSMVLELEEQGYSKSRTLFAMPYDWRFSNTGNARHLKERIDLALQRSGARQVQLVAHSMGGLLVRETLLSNISYQSKVRRVIYMGTPFLGSPRAYQALRFGYDFGIPFMDEETGRLIAEYAPAVYELLPSQKHHNLSPFLKKYPRSKYSYMDFRLKKELKVPYAPLLNQAIKLHDKWENKTIRNVKQYSIIGTGQSTLLGYHHDYIWNVFTPYYDNSTGDGTVPFVSADYAQSDISKKFYVKGEHAKLPVIRQVIEQVIHLLKGEEKAQSAVSKSSEKEYDYLYYMLMREDGEFPVVTIQKSGREMTIQPDKKEWWEDLSIEKHGNIVVIHSKDKQPLTFQLPAGEEEGIRVRVFSSEFSKKEREEGKEYRLTREGLVEMEKSRK